MTAARRIFVGMAALGLLIALAPNLFAAGPTIVLQALDKVSARISVLTLPIDGMVKFGTLEITARACEKAPPEEPPENAAFLEIVEARGNEAPQTLFSGWMFSSSPGLSALEHPVYDVWVLDCAPEAAAAPPAPPADSSAE
ncbi:MAG: DUF2155 domain-containing protein [Alphaproteobacteria bacterium]|nr:DUF2155 domain-containing protein [Alphaproteobacteria bacterium]